MSPFQTKTCVTGPRKEVYLYSRGALIYKAWFIDGVKTASRMFHAGEGLTFHLNKEFGAVKQ